MNKRPAYSASILLFTLPLSQYPNLALGSGISASPSITQSSTSLHSSPSRTPQFDSNTTSITQLTPSTVSTTLVNCTSSTTLIKPARSSAFSPEINSVSTVSPSPPDVYSPPLILSSEVYKGGPDERTALYVNTGKLSLWCSGSTPAPTGAANRLWGFSSSYMILATLTYTVGYQIAIPIFILQNFADYVLAKEDSAGENSFPVTEIQYEYEKMTVSSLINAGRIPTDATAWRMRRSEKLSTRGSPKVSFELYDQSNPASCTKFCLTSFRDKSIAITPCIPESDPRLENSGQVFTVGFFGSRQHLATDGSTRIIDTGKEKSAYYTVSNTDTPWHKCSPPWNKFMTCVNNN